MTATGQKSLYPNMVEAPLMYYIDDGTPAASKTGDEIDNSRSYEGSYEHITVQIRDARRLNEEFKLETNGFELVKHPTKVRDFYDPDEMLSVYYKETEELIKTTSGATRVEVFDHTLRSSDYDFRSGKPVREPVRRVHNDYTEWSGPQRVRDLIPGEADELLKYRFAIIQVWRGINKPIKSDPLCICDSRLLKGNQLYPSRRIYPDRVGETYVVTHSPEHEWLYFSEMTRDEAMVFKVYESAKDGRARWTAHTSFPLPNQDPIAHPRESCEMRALAFFGPE